jgi:hypothetical protein
VIEQLVAAAKTWPGMVKLVVVTPSATVEGEYTEVTVELGDTRRRWKRVAARLEPMLDAIVGAYGLNDRGERIGVWQAADDDDDEQDDSAAPRPGESDMMREHRLHTQWAFQAAGKMYESSIRLSVELVHAAVALIGSVRGPATSAAAAQSGGSDDATETLKLLLQSFMMSQHQRSDDGEAKRDARSESGPPAGQGPSGESG